MKQILKIMIVTLMVLCMVSCSSSVKQEEIIGMPNPIKEYSSLKDINEKANTHIVIPSSINATDFVYSTINDETAQVVFTLDNHKWTIRGSKNVDFDISGINDEHNTFVKGEDFCLYINDYYLDRIFTEDLQYSIVLSDANGYDEQSFSEYVFQMESALKKASDPNGIAGNYMDSVSQRATMEVLKYDDIYEITVRWPNSSSEEVQWCMSGSLDGNQLKYSGEDVSTYVYSENGEESLSDSTSINNVGYFDIKDNKLYWLGAGQDQCKECIFEKVDY